MKQNILFDSYIAAYGIDDENETKFFDSLLDGVEVEDERKRMKLHELFRECMTCLPFVIIRHGYMKSVLSTDCMLATLIRVIVLSGFFDEEELDKVTFSDAICMLTRHTLADVMIERFKENVDDFLTDFVFETQADVETKLYDFDYNALADFCTNSDKWKGINVTTKMFTVVCTFVMQKLQEEIKR